MTLETVTSRQLDCHGRAFGSGPEGAHRFLVGHLGPWLLVPGTNSSLTRDARLLGAALGHLLVVARGGGEDPYWASRSADLAVRAMARHGSSLIQRGGAEDGPGALDLALERWQHDIERLTDDPVGRHALRHTALGAALVGWPSAQLVTRGDCVVASAAAGTLDTSSGTIELSDDSLIVVATDALAGSLTDTRWLTSAAALPSASSASAALAEGAAERPGALAVARVRGLDLVDPPAASRQGTTP